MLPDGMLDYFYLKEFTVDEEPADKYLCKESVHLYLYERDNRSADQKATSESLGYNEGKSILDFPIMGKACRAAHLPSPAGVTGQARASLST